MKMTLSSKSYFAKLFYQVGYSLNTLFRAATEPCPIETFSVMCLKCLRRFVRVGKHLKHFIGKLEGNPFICLRYKQEKTGSPRSFLYYQWRHNDVTAIVKGNHCIFYFHNFFRYASAQVFFVSQYDVNYYYYYYYSFAVQFSNSVSKTRAVSLFTIKIIEMFELHASMSSRASAKDKPRWCLVSA